MSSLRSQPDRGFTIYIHWPYCARKCPYCDFNVYAAKDRDPEPLLDAIARDLTEWRVRSGPREVVSVFFGGGTPSLLSGAQTGDLLEHIDELWGLGAAAEITVEANPEDRVNLPDMAAAGVDRISLGVQSLDPAEIDFLGRLHKPEDALAALEICRRKFRSVSIDLIYGLPNQTLGAWQSQLRQALELGADHLSLYELSIEPGAAFAYAVRRGEWSPMDDDRAADLMEATYHITSQAGFPAYEISNHARSAEHQSRHNTVYWRGGDWVGVGPGAHGRLTTDEGRIATEAERRPADYIRLVHETGIGWSSSERLTPLDQARERIAMGLRMTEGIPSDALKDLGFTIDPAAIREAGSLGLMQSTDTRLALTTAGRLAADRVAAMIAP